MSLLCTLVMVITGTGCNNTSTTTSFSSELGVDSGRSATEQSSEDIILTLALTGSPEIQDVIDEFNAADNGYQIEVKRYQETVNADGLPISYTQEEWQNTDMEILQDIINTDEIDIICSESFSNAVYYEILKNKGAYADLYKFMAEDEKVNTATLNQHILDLNETNGKLYSLPTFYGATTLVGETQYVGSKANWTVDEFITYWNQMPKNATISGSRQSENVYYTLLRNNLESFVDYENAQVHFDSSDFKRILEFCNRFESNHGEKGVYDYNGADFVFPLYLDGFMSTSGFFSGETQYTLVGYPSNEGEGAFLSARDLCYSISAKSSAAKQEGAWQFIRTFASYEYQKSHVIEWIEYPEYPEYSQYSSERGFPINNRAFEDTAQAIIAGDYYKGTLTDKDVEYNVVLPNQLDYNKTVEYLNSIDRWEVKSHGPLWNILNEEVMYYLSGEKTIDETVSLIQSRASIWISEQS